MSGPMTSVSPAAAGRCPNCGAAHQLDALFCEECAYDFTGGRATSELATTGRLLGAPAAVSGTAPATPVTAAPGTESPLDVGWTGAVASDVPAAGRSPSDRTVCTECGQGAYADSYCDHCGAKQRDPRDHYTEQPQPWVAGVCDIGSRHRRNEDAMALYAAAEPLSFAVLVVCDGVSNSTDSHIASLAASRAARDVLDDPVPRGLGTRTAVVGAIEQRLAAAVRAAQQAVVETTQDRDVESPPSCTIVAAVIDRGTAVVGNVGDSRAYWVPDSPTSEPRQLSTDDSFADEQIRAGIARRQAETGFGAHAITRWLGADSPDDLMPHTTDLDLDEDGWLLVVSDGLWNYCSEAADLRDLVHSCVSRLGADGHRPAALAQALTDFALSSGGMDNITVSLARVGDHGDNESLAPAHTDPAADTDREADPHPLTDKDTR